MASSVNTGNDLSKPELHEAFSSSLSVICNNNEGIDHPSFSLPRDGDSLRNNQRPTSRTQEIPLLTLNSDDLLFLSPPPLNQQSIPPQIVPDCSSDFGDPVEYDELFGISPTLNSARTNDSPVVLDLTDSSLTTNLKGTGKRLAVCKPVERPAKTARVGSSRDASNKTSILCEEIDVVDLRSIDNMAQWEEKKKKDVTDANLKEANKPFKLSDFQCIICMDSPTDLTITHCGHMFCSDCLYQALHAGDKKCCPVCRNPVYLPKPGGRPGRNGVFALEIKLMTPNKKGKRNKG